MLWNVNQNEREPVIDSLIKESRWRIHDLVFQCACTSHTAKLSRRLWSIELTIHSLQLEVQALFF